MTLGAHHTPRVEHIVGLATFRASKKALGGAPQWANSCAIQANMKLNSTLFNHDMEWVSRPRSDSSSLESDGMSGHDCSSTSCSWQSSSPSPPSLLLRERQSTRIGIAMRLATILTGSSCVHPRTILRHSSRTPCDSIGKRNENPTCGDARHSYYCYLRRIVHVA